MNFKKCFLGVGFILLISLVVGCSNQQYPENTIAVIKNQIITAEMITAETIEREITLEMIDKMSELWASENTPPLKEIVLLAFDIEEKDLNNEQSRYLNYFNAQEKLLTENEAFNKVTRDLVLYEKAVQDGFLVTHERAREVLKEGDELTRQSMNENEQGKEKYAAILRFEDEVFKKYGFDSREDYWEKHVPKTATAATIQLMKNEFNKRVQQLNPNFTDPLQIKQHIAWEDYTEYLLKKGNLKILMDKYTIEFTGEAWPHGDWDLSLKSS